MNPSLPQKPPPAARSTSGFKPAMAFTPRAVAARNNINANRNNSAAGVYNAAPSAAPHYSAGSAPAYGGIGPQAPQSNYGGGYGYNNAHGQYHHDANGSGYGAHNYGNYGGNNSSNQHAVEPDFETQQMMSWQSAYVQGSPAGTPSAVSSENVPTAAAATGGTTGNPRPDDPATVYNTYTKTDNGHDGPKLTRRQRLEAEGWVVGQWRLFIGNLAGEVTDETLGKAFSAYASMSKAKVIRETVSTKSKGYGFVQFADSNDFLKAYQNMKNKYVGSHPIKIERASDTFFDEFDPKRLEKKYPTVINKTVHVHKRSRKGNNKRQYHSKGADEGDYEHDDKTAYNAKPDRYAEAGGRANTGAGVHKNKKQKTKDGLHLLG